MGLYRRLFRYQQVENRSQKENFLTEALADLFNRLSAEKQAVFLVDALHPSWADEVSARCGRARVIEAQTQVSIAVESAVKRPDMLISLDGCPFVVVEVKVDAALQRHLVTEDTAEAALAVCPPADRDQLATYGLWIAAQGRDGWPGAVVLITHATRAPENFEGDGQVGAMGTTHTWKQVGEWLANNLDLEDPDDTCCALAADLIEFLSEENLMPEFMNSQDLAATALFLPSAANIRHTFEMILKDILSAHPGLKSGRTRNEPWSEANAYLGWFYIQRGINVRRSAFALSIGVCFGGDAALADEDSEVLPRHEPFYFVYIADENNRVPVTDVLSMTPEGWALVHESWAAVVFRTLTSFPADPNVRFEAMVAWARTEVGRILAHVPAYRGGMIMEEDDSEED